MNLAPQVERTRLQRELIIIIIISSSIIIIIIIITMWSYFPNSPLLKAKSKTNWMGLITSKYNKS